MDEKIDKFLQEATVAHGKAGMNSVEIALNWTRAKHGPAVRASGEPAWEHDFRVASTLLDMGMDLDSIVAGMVHDTTENRVSGYRTGAEPPAGEEGGDGRLGAPLGKASHKGGGKEPKADERLREAHRKALSAQPDPRIAEAFGEEAAKLVAGVSRLSSVRAKNKTVHAAETMRKMLFAMTGDIRVIIVKLADKLDSMRTLKWLPEDRQKTIATECLDIFAPLADRLGISWLKDELEDLALKVLNREVFDQIKDIVSRKKETREKFLVSQLAFVGLLEFRLC